MTERTATTRGNLHKTQITKTTVTLPRYAPTRAERHALDALPDEGEGADYYCDLGVDYRFLESLEKKGLAGSRNRSEWWRTRAGAEAVTDAE